jgi:hypothetical protein
VSIPFERLASPYADSRKIRVRYRANKPIDRDRRGQHLWVRAPRPICCIRAPQPAWTIQQGLRSAVRVDLILRAIASGRLDAFSRAYDVGLLERRFSTGHQDCRTMSGACAAAFLLILRFPFARYAPASGCIKAVASPGEHDRPRDSARRPTVQAILLPYLRCQLVTERSISIV